MQFTRDNYKSFYVSEKFTSLTDQERESLIKFTVEQIRLEKNLGPIHLEFVHNGQPFGNGTWGPGSRGAMGSTGSNDDIQHYMYLNADALYRTDDAISYSVYKTINHEAEHGVQNTLIRNERISNNNAAVAELRANDSYYYSPGAKMFCKEDGTYVDRALYLSQVKEAQAREAGLNAVRNLVSENKKMGITDEAGEDYVFDLATEETKIKRDNIRAVGAHSREEMAKEAMDSQKELTPAQRKAVLKQARQADFDNLKAAFGDVYDEKTLKQMFENNSIAKDYYATDNYQETMSSIREKNGYDFLEKSSRSISGSLDSDEDFLQSNAPQHALPCETADEQFLDNAVLISKQKSDHGEAISQTNNVVQTI